VKLLKPIYGLTHLDEKWFRVARRVVFKKLDMFHIPKGQLLVPAGNDSSDKLCSLFLVCMWMV
jgi:hypothetical protein